MKTEGFLKRKICQICQNVSKTAALKPLLGLKPKMPPRMKIIYFEFVASIKYFLSINSIIGILELAHRKNLVQAKLSMYKKNA